MQRGSTTAGLVFLVVKHVRTVTVHRKHKFIPTNTTHTISILQWRRIMRELKEWEWAKWKRQIRKGTDADYQNCTCERAGAFVCSLKSQVHVLRFQEYFQHSARTDAPDRKRKMIANLYWIDLYEIFKRYHRFASTSFAPLANRNDVHHEHVPRCISQQKTQTKLMHSNLRERYLLCSNGCCWSARCVRH